MIRIIIIKFNNNIYSHIDYHLITYSIVISTSKIYSTLCEAESRLEENQKWNYTPTYFDDDFPLVDKLEANIMNVYLLYNILL